METTETQRQPGSIESDLRRSAGRPPERVTIGDEKVSISITRKTKGDLIVSQYAIERFFESGDEAARCIQQIVQATTLRTNHREPSGGTE